ncbi:MAG: biotin/lipoyl-binding protein, partial [Nitrospirota bacterium]|nr:biotin/lipoyl-binding protein [Nitrospirota bacterium]
MEEEKAAPDGNHKKKKFAMAVFAIVLLAAFVAGFLYVRYKDTHITTDDAFIDGDIYTIASKVAGTVKSVSAETNRFVKKGDLLVELDPADYEVKLSEAASALNAERSRLAGIDAKIETARRQVAESGAKQGSVKSINKSREANLRQAESDMKRMEGLYKEGLVS